MLERFRYMPYRFSTPIRHFKPFFVENSVLARRLRKNEAAKVPNLQHCHPVFHGQHDKETRPMTDQALRALRRRIYDLDCDETLTPFEREAAQQTLLDDLTEADTEQLMVLTCAAMRELRERAVA